MNLVRTISELDDRLAGERCVLVPTMGALHEGHLALIDEARRVAAGTGAPVAATIFVNPTQFNDPADLERYPRPIERDRAFLAERGVEVLFEPSVETVFPPERPNDWPQPDVPAVGRLPGLEDAFRPGHFEGVCRVVSRLFDLLRPGAAIFGEKDWQQTRVVSAMCAQQGRDVEIVVGPTVREADGVAMSSRNTHLPADARSRASAVIGAIRAAQAEDVARIARERAVGQLEAAGLEIEYAEIRDAATLLEPAGDPAGGPWRILVAARLAGVRLLDNAPWPA